jgi:hypothetical protein
MTVLGPANLSISICCNIGRAQHLVFVMTPPALPLEIIYEIISHLALENPTQLAYPPGHPVTRTLLSLALVSRSVYAEVIPKLTRHCLYLDTSQRLCAFLNLLQTSRASTNTLPEINRLPHVENLYLAPFGKTIDDLPTAIWIRELFQTVHPTLQRLVVDIPLHTVEPYQDHLGVRPILRDGFSQLQNLQEFASVRDEFFLICHEPEREIIEDPIWVRTWPRLTKLALYGIGPYSLPYLLMPFRLKSRLELAVLVRFRPTWGYLRSCCIDAVSGVAQNSSVASVKYVLVNPADKQPSYPLLYEPSEEQKQEQLTFYQYGLPVTYHGEEGSDEASIQWIKQTAIRGKIWDWDGAEILIKMDSIKMLQYLHST